MADPRVPIVLHVAVSDAGQSADFSASGVMGAVYITNRGGDPVYVAFDAVPANTDGNGRFLLQTGQPIALDDIKYTSIGFRCTAAITTEVDVIGLPRSGASGQGFA